MAIIQCDIRRGRTDDQKRRLAAGLTRVVCEVTGEPVERTFLVPPSPERRPCVS